MPQDQDRGALASAWGHESACKIAPLVGASIPEGMSNECVLNGARIVLKCARLKTGSVGVTYKMLERLDEVVGAFEAEDGSFELWGLKPEVFRQHMRETGSKGPSARKVGIVAKSVFEKYGRSVGRVRLP